MKRVLMILCASLLAAFLIGGMGTVVSSAPKAHAAGSLLTCTGSAVATYNPGLTNQTQRETVTVAETYAPCIASADPSLVSGTGTAIVILQASCTSFAVVPNTVTYRWNNGKSSTVVYGTNVVVRLADGSTQVTSTGAVVAGFGALSTVVRTITYPQLNLTACNQPPGVTTLTGAAVLTFL